MYDLHMQTWDEATNFLPFLKTHSEEAANGYIYDFSPSWRLPTHYELELIYDNRLHIGGFVSERHTSYYWTSTFDHIHQPEVRYKNFFNGHWGYHRKVLTRNIRAVRDF